MATSWLALALSEIGRFNAGFCIAAGAVVFAVAAWKTRPVADPGAPWILFIALASFALTLPPGENLLGGWDPGVYLHSGAQIARTGSLSWSMPDFSGLSDLEKETLLRSYGGAQAPFQGMWYLPDGKVSPQFFHLYPALLAVAFGAGGLRAALLVNPLLNAASILLLYAVARRFLSWRYALLAAVALLLNVAQVWQAEFTTAEMLTQCLLLAGIWCIARGSGWGGAAFGLALLCRYDTIMFLVPFAGAMALLWSDVQFRRRALASLALLIPFAAQAWWHQQHFSPYYHPASALVARAAIGFLVLLVIAVAALYVKPLSLRARLRRLEQPLIACAVALAALAALWAWWLRPGRPGAESANFLYVVDIFGPIGTAAGIAGLGVMAIKEREAWIRAWLVAGIVALGILTANLFNEHFMMWTARRFVPVVVPLFCVGLAWLASRFPRVGWIGALVALGLQAGDALFVARHGDWPGLSGWCRAVAGKIPDTAVVYCDQPGFAAPLRFLFNRRAFELHDRSDGRWDKLGHVMKERLVRGEDVYLLTMSERPETGAELSQVDAFPLESRVIRESRRGIPRDTKPRGGPFVLYRASLRLPPR